MKTKIYTSLAFLTLPYIALADVGTSNLQNVKDWHVQGKVAMASTISVIEKKSKRFKVIASASYTLNSFGYKHMYFMYARADEQPFKVCKTNNLPKYGKWAIDAFHINVEMQCMNEGALLVAWPSDVKSSENLLTIFSVKEYIDIEGNFFSAVISGKGFNKSKRKIDMLYTSDQ